MSDQSEHDAQARVIEWARYNERRWDGLRWLYANVNGAKLPYRKTRGGKRFSAEAIKLKAEGLTPGVSDLFLPYPAGGYCGMFIEMKIGSNKPTQEQSEFIADMNKRGYLATVCWGSWHAIASISTYLGIPDREWSDWA